MFDTIDNPIAFTNGWNRGFDAGVNFLKEHIASEEFSSKLEQNGIDKTVITKLVSLIDTETKE